MDTENNNNMKPAEMVRTAACMLAGIKLNEKTVSQLPQPHIFTITILVYKLNHKTSATYSSTILVLLRSFQAYLPTSCKFHPYIFLTNACQYIDDKLGLFIYLFILC